MATATADIAACLPKDLREAFEKHYAKQESTKYQGGGDNADGHCSRCGAVVPWSKWMRHELWHKNASCQLWMISRFPMEHMRQHQAEGRVIAELIGNILGFIDPPDGPTSGDPDEEFPIQKLRVDDTVIPPHTHKDGTTHDH